MLTVVLTLAVLGAIGALAYWLPRALSALRVDSGVQLAERNAEMERRLQGLNETMDRRLAQLDRKVDHRLESASKTTTQVHERLVKLDEANAQMLERANRVSRMVPVDAKFPLDNFARLAEAQDTAERELHEKAFARDVKGHIDAIASKYIRPDEGTYEFAFMYLPSEAVYYELACGKTGELLKYAHERQIVPVSPSTFTAYLQMIVLGLKGMQIEEHAQEVMAYCAQLQKDFGRFKEDFDLVGTHLGRAQTKFVDAEKRLDKFETKLDQAADSRELDAAGDVVAELPRAADAA